MKTISLKNGGEAIIDDEDFEYLNQWTWYVSTFGYAVRKTQVNNKRQTIWMHREINQTPIGLFTDHQNRNKLDNRKCNLRTVTKSENALNTGLCSRNTSGYKGVWFNKRTDRWHVEIRWQQQKKHIGSYRTLNEAIISRKQVEQVYGLLSQ